MLTKTILLTKHNEDNQVKCSRGEIATLYSHTLWYKVLAIALNSMIHCNSSFKVLQRNCWNSTRASLSWSWVCGSLCTSMGVLLLCKAFSCQPSVYFFWFCIAFSFTAVLIDCGSRGQQGDLTETGPQQLNLGISYQPWLTSNPFPSSHSSLTSLSDLSIINV